ncbi:hypothetical protein EV137_4400 [Kribbella pratensis]|jgi:hypothetical protein|uniref:Uncharacterized protein n=1 Tax=Kribbella pratensis TaxID=2512112 RepID=A0ABY2FHJ5_9ACTN|nr:hypothetical protein EV137_4400 [Kribbella pratensis]TDW98311.1 hypothetical protein EV647_3017 [Kribbella sp. VKM Ac-2566]
MTGDFLPRRQKASVLSQAVTVVILLAVVAVGIVLFT